MSVAYHQLPENFYTNAITLLKQAGIEQPEREAMLLLAHVLNTTREQLLMEGVPQLTAEQQKQFEGVVERRAGREPMSHILGKREFYGREFIVTPDVLDPRPDTETLVEAVLERVNGGSWIVNGEKNGLSSTIHHSPSTILDLGTGSGCILLTLLAELPYATGVGMDISTAALAVASQNAKKLGISTRAEFIHKDFAEGNWGLFDIIVANPPYIETEAIAGLMPEVAYYEPRQALDGGKDGLDCYRKIAIHLACALQPDGLAALEIGARQSEDVTGIMAAAGLCVNAITHDLAGNARCIIVTRPSMI